MLQLALRTLRFRRGTFAAALIAMFFAAAILMACGGLIETGIRTAVPPQQLASADAVVAGNQETGQPQTRRLTATGRVAVDLRVHRRVGRGAGLRRDIAAGLAGDARKAHRGGPCDRLEDAIYRTEDPVARRRDRRQPDMGSAASEVVAIAVNSGRPTPAVASTSIPRVTATK